MHLSLGFVSLAVILIGSACSSNSSTSGAGAKGNATINFDRNNGCTYNNSFISSSDKPPTLTDLGGTVSNGKDYQVSCKLAATGASYSLEAHIESTSIMSLNIQSSDISVGSTMLFYVAGTGGTPSPITSTDATNNAASTCTFTTSSSNTLLTVGSGTIFAEYDCPKAMAATNVGTICHTTGLVQFTGCSD